MMPGWPGAGTERDLTGHFWTLSEEKMDEERKLKDRGQREETVATVLVTILMRIIGRSLNRKGSDDNNNNLWRWVIVDGCGGGYVLLECRKVLGRDRR